MLECNRYIHKKLTAIVRVVSLLLPIVCILLLLSQVVFAKNTYLINDGGRVLVHTTYTTDPEEVLTEAGLELGKDDTFTTQEGIGVSEITIRRSQQVQVVCGDETLSVTTYGETVEELLSRLDITLGETDTVSAELSAETYDGMSIVVSCIVEREETYTVPVAYETYYRYDPSLAEDQQEVLIQGCDGLTTCVDAVRYQEGREIGRENRSQTVTAEPVRQIVAVGSIAGIPQDALLISQEEDAPTVSEYLAGTCELFIGDGLIITPDGELLTYGGTMQVKATAYTHTDAGCDTITATGTTVHWGTVAVDPKVIPYGTRMYIVTNDGKFIYGISVAEDCGGAIKKNRIDLYFPTVDECWAFGVRQATIYFLDGE